MNSLHIMAIAAIFINFNPNSDVYNKNVDVKKGTKRVLYHFYRNYEVLTDSALFRSRFSRYTTVQSYRYFASNINFHYETTTVFERKRKGFECASMG